MTEHTGDLQDKWTRRWTFTTESQIGLAAQYITQLKKEKEELRIECNRLYGIGQDYDEEVKALEKTRIDLCVMLKEWMAFIHKERLGELHRETNEILERNMARKETPCP